MVGVEVPILEITKKSLRLENLPKSWGQDSFNAPNAIFTPVALLLIDNFFSFITDVPPSTGGDKPRAHLTGNAPWNVFQKTIGHGPEISFCMFAKTYSSSFKLESTPFDKKLLSSVKGFQMSSFLEGFKHPSFLGIFFQILSAPLPFTTVFLFH